MLWLCAWFLLWRLQLLQRIPKRLTPPITLTKGTDNLVLSLKFGTDLGLLSNSDGNIGVQSFDILDDNTFVLGDTVNHCITFVKDNIIINKINIPDDIKIGSILIRNDIIFVLDNIKSLDENKILYKFDTKGNLLEEIKIPLNEENAINVDLGNGSIDKIYRQIEYLRTNENSELLLVYGNGDRYKLINNILIKEDLIDIKCEDASNIYSKYKKMMFSIHIHIYHIP